MTEREQLVIRYEALRGLYAHEFGGGNLGSVLEIIPELIETAEGLRVSANCGTDKMILTQDIRNYKDARRILEESFGV